MTIHTFDQPIKKSFNRNKAKPVEIVSEYWDTSSPTPGTIECRIAIHTEGMVMLILVIEGGSLNIFDTALADISNIRMPGVLVDFRKV